MECTVSWTGGAGTRSGMGFVAETGSGHILAMDGAPDAANPANGGLNLAPRPMETLLAGTGGCTAYDVVLILKRGRHDVRGCSVKLTSQRAEVDPKVFTAIHMQFTVTGKGLAPAVVERASFALIEFLECVLAGKQVSPVALFPQYRDAQALVGAERVHPADLWPGDARLREPEWVVQAPALLVLRQLFVRSPMRVHSILVLQVPGPLLQTDYSITIDSIMKGLQPPKNLLKKFEEGAQLSFAQF